MIRFLRLAILLQLFFYSLPGHAQKRKPQVCKPPSWVEEIHADYNRTVNANEVQDGYFYLLADYQRNAEEKTNFVHLALKIVSESGVQNSSQVSIDYNPEFEQLCLHKIELIRNGKRINKLELSKIKSLQRETDLERNIYDGTFTAMLILDDVRKGDILEYSYSVQGKNPIFSEKFSEWFYTEYSVPIGEYHRRIISDASRKLRIKEFNNCIKPDVQQKDGKNIYVWRRSDVKPLLSEDKLPQWYDPYAYASVSEYANWSEVKDWTKGLFVLNEALSPELKDTIRAIGNRNTTKEQIAVDALRFVQNQIRYMGIEIGVYSHLPNTPNKVFKQRFGDCKDKSQLLCRMLKELNVEAHPVLISTSSFDELPNALPSPLVFNHCTVQIKIDGKAYWVDPTISYQGGTLENNSFPDYRWGLVVTDNSADLTKIESPKPGKIRIHEKFEVTELGKSCDLTVNTIYEGDEADLIRYQVANTSIVELGESYKNFYAKLYAGIRSRDSMKLVDYPELNKYAITEYYTIDDFWKEDSLANNGQLKASFEAMMMESYISLPKTRIRKMPIGIRHKTNIHQCIEIKLPEPWGMTPEREIFSTSAFTYSYNYSYNDPENTILLNYDYETFWDFIPASEATAYINTVDKIYDNVSFQLTYTKGPAKAETAASAERSGNNWPLIAFVLFYSGIVCYVFYKLYFINTGAEIQTEAKPVPATIGGWLVLVLIGVCIRPLVYIVQLFTSKYFDANNLQVLSEQNGYWTLVIIFEVIAIVSLFFFSIFILILFLSYRNSLPRFYIIFMIFALVASLIDYLIVTFLMEGAATVSSSTLISNFIGCGIWIPYFLLSQRVKETFVIRYKKKNEN